MATQKLNLTRDQLTTFLKNHEQIKQFERLFQVADEVAPASDTVGISIQAGNADATANEALAQVAALYQDLGLVGVGAVVNEAIAQIAALSKTSAIDSGNASQKAVEALDRIERIASALEFLALAPVRNNIELSHDVNGILPYSNQTARVRSNQVLLWLST